MGDVDVGVIQTEKSVVYVARYDIIICVVANEHEIRGILNLICFITHRQRTRGGGR